MAQLKLILDPDPKNHMWCYFFQQNITYGDFGSQGFGSQGALSALLDKMWITKTIRTYLGKWQAIYVVFISI
jgi:hypothetical protein